MDILQNRTSKLLIVERGCLAKDLVHRFDLPLQVCFASSVEEAKDIGPVDIVLTAERLSDGDGFAVIYAAGRLNPKVVPILMSTTEGAAVRRLCDVFGASRIAYPPSPDDLETALERAICDTSPSRARLLHLLLGLQKSKKSCIVRINGSRGSAKIEVEQGRVQRCRCEGLAFDDALERALSLGGHVSVRSSSSVTQLPRKRPARGPRVERSLPMLMVPSSLPSQLPRASV